jgi:hypothetical protein
MLPREQLYADKFMFAKDSVIPINALDLISELKAQEQLARDLQKVQAQLDYWRDKAQRLELEMACYGRHYDIRA